MLFVYFEDPERNLLEWCTEIDQIDEATHQPRSWEPSPALNLWPSPGGMGPPKGFAWLLPVVATVSKLCRRLFPKSALSRKANKSLMKSTSA